MSETSLGVAKKQILINPDTTDLLEQSAHREIKCVISVCIYRCSVLTPISIMSSGKYPALPAWPKLIHVY